MDRAHAAAVALATDPAHLAVCRRIARAHARRRPWLADDFESDALLRLWQVARLYAARPDRGVAFADLLKWHVRRACLDTIARARPLGYRRSRPARRRGVPPARLSLDDLPAGPDPDGCRLPVGWEADSEDALRALCGRLSPRHRALVERLYLHAATPDYETLGRALAVHPANVGRGVAAALAHLRGAPS
jgi:DNA-directed RNA polymerase specialized sigma24 family protein